MTVSPHLLALAFWCWFYSQAISVAPNNSQLISSIFKNRRKETFNPLSSISLSPCVCFLRIFPPHLFSVTTYIIIYLQISLCLLPQIFSYSSNPLIQLLISQFHLSMLKIQFNEKNELKICLSEQLLLLYSLSGPNQNLKNYPTLLPEFY